MEASFRLAVMHTNSQQHILISPGSKTHQSQLTGSPGPARAVPKKCSSSLSDTWIQADDLHLMCESSPPTPATTPSVFRVYWFHKRFLCLVHSWHTMSQPYYDILLFFCFFLFCCCSILENIPFSQWRETWSNLIFVCMQSASKRETERKKKSICPRSTPKVSVDTFRCS